MGLAIINKPWGILALPAVLLAANRDRRWTALAAATIVVLWTTATYLGNPVRFAQVYYQVPFVLALGAWEARTTGWPLLALWATGGFWFIFHTVSGLAGLDVQLAAYVDLTLPLAAVLMAPAFGCSWRWPRSVALLPGPGYRLTT